MFDTKSNSNYMANFCFSLGIVSTASVPLLCEAD